MTPEQVYRYYGSSYQFQKKTGISGQALLQWIKKGYIPDSSQCHVQVVSNGALMRDSKDADFDVVRVKRVHHHQSIIDSFTAEQRRFIEYAVTEWTKYYKNQPVNAKITKFLKASLTKIAL